MFAAKGEPPDAQQHTARTLTGALEALPPLGIAKPRSRCPACGPCDPLARKPAGDRLAAAEGPLQRLRQPHFARYPLIELLTGALFAAIGWRFGAQPAALMWCAVAAALVALAAIDWDTTVLPDALNFPLLWGGLVAAGLGWTLPLPTALLGRSGGLPLAVVGLLAVQAHHRQEGMGYGDFKLLAALGAWLGWQAIVPILLMSSVIGAVVGIGMKMRSSLREGRYVPFGPFLAGAGLVVLLAGTQTVLGWIGWA